MTLYALQYDSLFILAFHRISAAIYFFFHWLSFLLQCSPVFVRFMILLIPSNHNFLSLPFLLHAFGFPSCFVTWSLRQWNHLKALLGAHLCPTLSCLSFPRWKRMCLKGFSKSHLGNPFMWPRAHSRELGQQQRRFDPELREMNFWQLSVKSLERIWTVGVGIR